MDILSNLASKHNSDKIDHQYTQIYHNLFNSIRNDNFNLLEIGVLYGASLKMWHEYFPNANIYGADNFFGYNGNGTSINNPLCFIDELINNNHILNRINLNFIDQSDYNELNEFANNINIKFKFILDDGSHLMKDQQITFFHLFDLIESGGYYIIENVQTCDHEGYDVLSDKSNSTKKFFEQLSNGEFNSLYINNMNDKCEIILSQIHKIELIKSNNYSEVIIIYKK
jgi:hypothetical protein